MKRETSWSEKSTAHLPSTREEARAQGLDRYFTGVPCINGHMGARYVSTNNCVQCQVEHARRNGGWNARPSKEEYFRIAQELVEQKRGILLSKEYISARSKLVVRCSRGHQFETTLDNLRSNKWCRACWREDHSQRMISKLRTVDELREFARQQHAGDCLATVPSGMLSKVPWKCSNVDHQQFDAVIAKVFKGQWCPACWEERRKPPKPPISLQTLMNLLRERGGELIQVVSEAGWKGSKARVAIKCANGHEWEADAASLIYRRSWCPECLYKGERVVRAIFEETFGRQFPKARHAWLISTKGHKLDTMKSSGWRRPFLVLSWYLLPSFVLSNTVSIAV